MSALWNLTLHIDMFKMMLLFWFFFFCVYLRSQSHSAWNKRRKWSKVDIFSFKNKKTKNKTNYKITKHLTNIIIVHLCRLSYFEIINLYRFFFVELFKFHKILKGKIHNTSFKHIYVIYALYYYSIRAYCQTRFLLIF